MRTFLVVDRGNFFADGAFAGFPMLVFGVISILLLGCVASAWLPAFGILLAGILITIKIVGTQVYEVRVHPDGIAEYRRRWTTFRIAAQDIRTIVVKQTTDEDGDIYCKMVIRHGWRLIDFPCSSVADEFLAEMCQLNPTITVLRPAQRWWG